MFENLKLDPESGSPLYRQFFIQFKDLIAHGGLKNGDRLPPTRDLAGSLGVNRATVSSAYALLESEGLIRGHVGRGSFVLGETRPPGSGLNREQFLPAPGLALP